VKFLKVVLAASEGFGECELKEPLGFGLVGQEAVRGA
jgi:hypothetical protein